MEFSQRPAHVLLPGAHGYIAAVAGAPPSATHAHYAYPGQRSPPTDSYPEPLRRLPSVSELLVSPDAQQTAPYAAPDRPACQQPYMAGAYACPPVDIPGHRAPERVHRDSESASSVSSIATLVDKHSPAAYHHHAGPKQYRVQAAPAAVAAAAPHDVYEDDVFMAANILMSLRTCKLPC